jgi:hypothetical protein
VPYQSKCEDGCGESWASVIDFFRRRGPRRRSRQAPGSRGRGRETKPSHLSIRPAPICSTHSLGQSVIDAAAASFSTPFSLSGAPRDLLQTFRSCTCQASLPTQPLPCRRSCIGRHPPCQISSRASPRIASLPLAHSVDKRPVLPHQSDSISAVSVVTGFQLCSYAPNSQEPK